VEAGTVPVRAVFFDVVETLNDESTEYGAWADWLGVPRHTFSATFGAVIARGEDYRRCSNTSGRVFTWPSSAGGAPTRGFPSLSVGPSLHRPEPHRPTR
jgi:hypothetical protein